MRLKELRESHSKTQKEVADFLRVRQNTYSQYETSQRQIPINMLIKLSVYYNTSVDYILELTEIEDAYPKK